MCRYSRTALRCYDAVVNSAVTNDNQTVTVALLDDDPEIRTLVCDHLERYGLKCIAAATAEHLQRILRDEAVDLLLLDIMLPNANGLDLCKTIRATSRLPIILLTALADESDRVLGLELGADDYLTKPFGPRELLARIRAVLRRVDDKLWVHQQRADEQMHFKGWRLSVPHRTLTDPSGVVITLTGGEFDLLLAFVANPGVVLSRDELLEMTKGRLAQPFDRSVDVQLSRLRKKLGDGEMIKTVRGGGYLFAEEVTRLA